MTVDLDNTQPGLKPEFDNSTVHLRALGTECDADEPVTAREWMSLGVLCMKAAEEMRALGSYVAAKHYASLARKCDLMFEETSEKPRQIYG